MRYACINHRCNHYSVRMMCCLLDVSASGYYAWLGRPESSRMHHNRELLKQIRSIHEASKGVYGSPRVHAELVAEGVCVGRHKVAHLMRSARLRGCPKRRYRTTTQSDPTHRVAHNLLKQNFAADGPDQRWASDITYISTRQGWLYLAVTMDLFSRRIVGPSRRTLCIRLPGQRVDEPLDEQAPGCGRIADGSRSPSTDRLTDPPFRSGWPIFKR